MRLLLAAGPTEGRPQPPRATEVTAPSLSFLSSMIIKERKRRGHLIFFSPWQRPTENQHRAGLQGRRWRCRRAGSGSGGLLRGGHGNLSPHWLLGSSLSGREKSQWARWEQIRADSSLSLKNKTRRRKEGRTDKGFQSRKGLRGHSEQLLSKQVHTRDKEQGPSAGAALLSQLHQHQGGLLEPWRPVQARVRRDGSFRTRLLWKCKSSG